MTDIAKYDIVFKALEEIEFGKVSIQLPDQKTLSYESKNPDAVAADISIVDMSFFDELLSGGDVGLGESYMKGLWCSNNLPAFIEFCVLNANTMESFFHANKFKMFMLAIKAFFRKNSKKGSKSNISYHYDLGNDFYSLWLDESMTYSSAIFSNSSDDLHQAQMKKYHRIIENIDQGRILEIGCGWGSFAIEAAKLGNSIKCLTLSKEQAKYAQQKIASQGLQDKISINIQDYRDEKEVYDSIVSIEMFEAVGKKYWPLYFATIRDCLKVGGKAMVQVITICDDVYNSYKKRSDFIQKHIFPGGYLPSKSAFKECVSNNSLKVIDEYSFGQDYAKTLLLWLNRFDKVKEDLLKMGFDEVFINKWRFYLSYCYAGFRSARTDVVQFLIEK